jgi:hypothetical protein
MRVQWSASTTGCPIDIAYGTAGGGGGGGPGGLHSDGIARGQPAGTYGAGDMCASPANAAGGPIAPHFYEAILTGLAPGRQHEYRFVSRGGPDGPPTLVARRPPLPSSTLFRAAPVKGPAAGAALLAFGDMGTASHPGGKCPGAAATAAAVADAVAKGRATAVLHLGDVAYADGTPGAWDAFMDLVEPAAASAPWLVAAGNHDVGWMKAAAAVGGSESGRKGAAGRGRSSPQPPPPSDPTGATSPYSPSWGNYGNDSGGECGVPLAARFRGAGPSPGGGGEPPFWYAGTHGPIHFVIISTEHDLSPRSKQAAWIKAALAAVDRCVTPWLVVAGHRPLYVPFPHKSNREVGDHLRGFLEPLLEAAGVDVYVSGHVHAYARTCNVWRDGQCVARSVGGTTHVLAGTGGRKLSDIAGDQSAWLEAAAELWGFVRLDAAGGDALRLQFVASEDGQVVDEVELRGADRGELLCRAGRAAAAARAGLAVA